MGRRRSGTRRGQSVPFSGARGAGNGISLKVQILRIVRKILLLGKFGLKTLYTSGTQVRCIPLGFVYSKQ